MCERGRGRERERKRDYKRLIETNYRFFCRAAKFLLKVGLIWFRSSTREWLRKLGLAGLGLKL